MHGVVAQFLPQMTDEDAQVMGVFLVAAAPDLAEDLLMGQDLALAGHEEGEEAEEEA